MTAKEALDIMRHLLNTAIPELDEAADAKERLVRAVSVFISLPAALQSEIGMEAISRQARAAAAGKKPWEIAP
jgi:hypothetical protein